MEAFLDRLLAAWVGGARRNAKAVLWLALVTSLGAVAFAVLNLGVNTSHRAIISDDLPFWQDYYAFEEHFPILDEALIVVVDADTPGGARDAALALADRLAAEPELFDDVYVPAGDDFFQRNALLYLSVEELEELTDQMAQVQPLMAEIARDRSLTHMANVLSQGIERLRTHPDTPVDFTPVFDSWSRAIRSVLEGNPKPISWTELILRRKMPGDSSRRVIVVHPIFDYSRLLPGLEAMDRVDALASELGLTPQNGFLVRTTGNVALNTEEMLGVARGALFAIGSSLVLVALLLSVALRRWHLVLGALLTLLAALSWTAGFAAAAIGHINLISVCFAILVIGLGIDFAIHFAMRYAELVRAGESHEDALDDASTSVGGSLVLCAGTTTMSFLVFVPTEFKAVGELGIIAGAGMLLSLVSTLTVLPAWLTALRDQPAGYAWAGAPWFERALVVASSHHPIGVRVGAALLALASVALLPRLHFDHNPGHMRDPDTESVQAFDELLTESETSPWTMEVPAQSLERAVEIAERLRELDVVERAVTLQDYVPLEQDAKLDVLAELGYFVPEPPPEDAPTPEVPLAQQVFALRALEAALRAPWLEEGDPERAASAARAAGYLERFLLRLDGIDQKAQQQRELADFERSLTGALPDTMRRLWLALDPEGVSLDSLPRDLTTRMLADEGIARVEVLPAEDLDDNVAHARFVDTVRGVVPGATGSAVTVLEFGRAVWRSFVQALASAILAIALLLWLLWRRVGDMLLVMAPLTLATLLTSAAAALLGISFNFANVIVIPLLLGIGVDSGIHLVHRWRVDLQSGHAHSPARALLETSTAQAVFFSALTTMASFGTMAFASHRGFASLGQLLVIGVFTMLLANLVVLPALLTRSGDEQEQEAEAADGGAR